MFFFNDAIVSKEKNLYLLGNLGANTLGPSLLTHSYFTPKEFSIKGNLTFEDWRTDPSKADTAKGMSVDLNILTQNQSNLQGQTVSENQNINNNNNNNNTIQDQNPNSNGSSTTNNNNNNILNTVPTLVDVNSFLQIESLHPSVGFFPTNISFSPPKSAFSLGQRPGMIVSPNTSIVLSPSPFYFLFKPFLDRNDLPDSSQYSNTQHGVSFSYHDTSEADSQFGRVHTPTFYIRFLIASGSSFPLTLFVKGDIQSKNSLAVVLRTSDDLKVSTQKSTGQQTQVFRPQVFFRDNRGVMFNFDCDFSFKLDSVHSLAVTYVKLFGNYSQIVTMFDDGEHFSSSSIIHTIVDNSTTPLYIFPKVSLLSEIISLESTDNSQSTSEEGKLHIFKVIITNNLSILKKYVIKFHYFEYNNIIS